MTRTFVSTLLAAGLGLAAAPSCVSAPTPWVTGYYAGWQQDRMAPSEIDMRPITHLVYFALAPTNAGTVSRPPKAFSDANADEVARVAHAAGKKALICLGGANSGAVFKVAINDQHRATFVKSIMDWVKAHHYDGVDVDMEPIEKADDDVYQKFVHDMRVALNAYDPHDVLTAAVAAGPDVYKPLVNDLDQINLMTYDMSGPWGDYDTWYNSPLTNGGKKFKANGNPMPCIESSVNEWISAGVPAAKIGIGCAFYGTLWRNAAGPNESIAGTSTEDVSYYDLMDRYYSKDFYHWDDVAQAPYLSIVAPQNPQTLFISYDDDRLTRLKMHYLLDTKLGGCIIWEIGDGYRPHLPAGHRNPLLQAMYDGLNGKND